MSVTATLRTEHRVLVIAYRGGAAVELDTFGDLFTGPAEAEPALRDAVRRHGYRLRSWQVGQWVVGRTRQLAQFLALVEAEPPCPRTSPKDGRLCNRPAGRAHPCAGEEA